jgi:hypothetical protein
MEVKITHHTQLIQALINKYGLKSYCEIGVQSTAQNFDKIICEYKVGVDPEVSGNNIVKETSDFFFENYTIKCDIFFLDGLHTKEQIKKDFENALSCLSDHGFIVIHDVLPENEAGTLVPRIQRQWWGDVYKWAMVLRNYSGIRFVTFNIDNGCMLVWKDDKAEPLANYNGPCDWETYKSIGGVLLNVTNEVVI